MAKNKGIYVKSAKSAFLWFCQVCGRETITLSDRLTHVGPQRDYQLYDDSIRLHKAQRNDSLGDSGHQGRGGSKSESFMRNRNASDT
jgi:hypothetical protein